MESFKTLSLQSQRAESLLKEF